MHETVVDALNMRATESRSTEVALEELKQTEVRSDQVVCIMLTPHESGPIGRSKFLLHVEGVQVVELLMEETKLSSNRLLEILSLDKPWWDEPSETDSTVYKDLPRMNRCGTLCLFHAPTISVSDWSRGTVVASHAV